MMASTSTEPASTSTTAMVTLSDLPVEIKSEIFRHLSGYDKFQVMDVCRDFKAVCLSRDVMHTLDFSRNFGLTGTHLKFLKLKPFCTYITCLNVNGAYWISLTTLRKTLERCINLTELQVLDTKLNQAELALLINNYTTKVRKLAFTYNNVVSEVIRVPITHLLVVYNMKCSFRDFITRLLLDFPTVFELWMIETNCVKPDMFYQMGPLEWVHKHQFVNMKRLKKLVLRNFQNACICQRFHIPQWFELEDSEWRCTYHFQNEKFAIYENMDYITIKPKKPAVYDIDLMEVLDQLPSNLSEIFSVNDKRNIKLERLVPSDIMFESLNLVKQSKAKIPVSESKRLVYKSLLFHQNLTKLRRLNADSFVFFEKKSETESNSRLFKKQRRGIATPTHDLNNTFMRFTLFTPEMEEFSLSDDSVEGFASRQWNPRWLKYIVNWPKLKKLALQSVNFEHMKFLVEIAENCPMLESLKIKNDSVTNPIAYVCNALEFAPKLRIFRYETKGGIFFDDLMTALAKCKRLEMICIQCYSVTRLTKELIQKVIDECGNLVCFYILFDNMPLAFHKNLTKNLRFRSKLVFHVAVKVPTSHPETHFKFFYPSCHSEVVNHANQVYLDYLREF